MNPEWDRLSLKLQLNAIASHANTNAVSSQEKDAFGRLWGAVPVVEPTQAWPGIGAESVNRAVRDCLVSPAGSAVEATVKLYLKGDYRSAAEKAKREKTLTCQTQDWALAYIRARAYFLASDFDAAEEVLEGSLPPYSQLPSVTLLRAEVEAQLGLRYFRSGIGEGAEV